MKGLIRILFTLFGVSTGMVLIGCHATWLAEALLFSEHPIAWSGCQLWAILWYIVSGTVLIDKATHWVQQGHQIDAQIQEQRKLTSSSREIVQGQLALTNGESTEGQLSITQSTPGSLSITKGPK